MPKCLSELDLRNYLTGALPQDQRAQAGDHLRDCPSCSNLLDQITSASVLGAGTHAAKTQVEVTSAMEHVSRSGSGLSHWTDSGIEQATPASAPSGPGLSVAQFLQHLSQSGLLQQAELASVKAQADEASHGSTVAELIDWLIHENKLTRYQAELLCRGQRGGLVLGNYIILEKLGQGGMGAVFKARHRRMNRIVALKVLPASLSNVPEAILRFQREVEAAAKLTHPNIAAAYDADEAEGVHFLVMEHVDGPNLAAYVKERGALPLAPAVRLLVQAARGLGLAHQMGIVHRDIKPSNLMVNRQGALKILDMGLAQMRDNSSSIELTSDVTQTGRVMGTVDYMAPEQARDAKNVDFRADMYSLGCTAWFMITGSTPAPSGSAAEKLLWHQAVSPPPLSEVCPAATPRLSAIVARMMAKQAADRPASMDEIAEELEHCLAELPASEETLVLDGVEIPVEEHSSTLHGSRGVRRTMLEVGKTVATATALAPAAIGGASQGQSRGRKIALAVGLVGLIAVASLAVLPFIRKPQPGPAPPIPAAPVQSMLVVTADHGPAEVFVNGQLMGRLSGDTPVELSVDPGSYFVQIKGEGLAPYERQVKVTADRNTQIAAVLRRIDSPNIPAVAPRSPHAPYEKLLAWAFQNSGRVHAITGKGQPLHVTAMGQLPAEPVEIVGIDLNRTGVRNAELANLAAAPGLRELSLANTPITDEGLAHILPLRQLTHLNLAETDITSGGLAQLSRLANLIELDLQKTQITDQGLSRLAGLAALERLYLADTEVTDVGIDQLKGLKSLKLLTLNNTGFSEAGHASLVASVPELQIAWDGADAQRAAAARLLEKGATLTLLDRQNQLHQGLKTREALPAGRVVVKEADLSTGMGLDDDDLKLLVALPDIESLRLVNVSVTPAGLGHLHALATLKKIDLGTIRVPAAAVAALQKALPGCQVVSMEPADVEVARAVIAGMGRVTVVTERGLVHTDLNAVEKLPAGNYSIRAINLEDSAAATDEFLAQMVELPALESLYLSRSGITDDGVAQLAGAQSLRELSLTGTKITAASIGVLARLPALTRLYLAHTDIGSEGARLAANIPGLTHLSLQDVKLADDDLALLKRLEKLEWLDLSGTPITDNSLAHLSHLQTLRELHIAGTQITDAGQEELVGLLPNCRSVGDPLDLQRLAVRWVVQNKGTVVLDSGPISSLKALPRDACHILSIDLAELALLKPSDIVKHLLGCAELQALSLSSTPVREIDLPVVSKLVTLKELRLAGVPATDASLKHFAPLSKLEVLDLSGTRVSGSGLRELAGCSELRQLVLAGAQFDERNMAAIEPFAKLEMLDVGMPRNFTDTGAAALEKYPNLKVLSLRNAKITDAALDKIATLKNLQELDLEGTPVTDAGVAKLAGLSNLRRIVLSRTGVGTGVISTLSNMKSLKSIALQRTGVTADSVKQLQAALPTASISSPSPPPVDPNNPGGQPAGGNFNPMGFNPAEQPGGRASGSGLLPR